MTLNDLLEFYTDSALSVFATDMDFNLTYCNESAKTTYPYFSTPAGFKSMFSEKEWEGFSHISELTPSFTAEGSDTVIEGTFFCITRIKNEGYILIPDAVIRKNSRKAKEIIDTLSPVFMSEINDILSCLGDKSEQSRRIKSAVYRLNRFYTNVTKYKLLSCTDTDADSMCDVASLMHSLCDMVKSVTDRKPTGFSGNVAPGTAFVNCSAEDLAYAVCQLISNCIKFSGKSVFIELTMRTTDKDVCITVKDNGIGMDKNVLSECEKPYYSYYLGGKTPVCAGLGLTIAKMVSIAYGGNFTITSHPKKGTETTITFPIAKNSFMFSSIDTDYGSMCRRIVPTVLSDSINITDETEDII